MRIFQNHLFDAMRYRAPIFYFFFFHFETTEARLCDWNRKGLGHYSGLRIRIHFMRIWIWIYIQGFQNEYGSNLQLDFYSVALTTGTYLNNNTVFFIISTAYSLNSSLTYKKIVFFS